MYALCVTDMHTPPPALPLRVWYFIDDGTSDAVMKRGMPLSTLQQTTLLSSLCYNVSII